MQKHCLRMQPALHQTGAESSSKAATNLGWSSKLSLASANCPLHLHHITPMNPGFCDQPIAQPFARERRQWSSLCRKYPQPQRPKGLCRSHLCCSTPALESHACDHWSQAAEMLVPPGNNTVIDITKGLYSCTSCNLVGNRRFHRRKQEYTINKSNQTQNWTSFGSFKSWAQHWNLHAGNNPPAMCLAEHVWSRPWFFDQASGTPDFSGPTHLDPPETWWFQRPTNQPPHPFHGPGTWSSWDLRCSKSSRVQSWTPLRDPSLWRPAQLKPWDPDKCFMESRLSPPSGSIDPP